MRKHTDTGLTRAADRLCALYGVAFGGKESGRYRIAAKLIRVMTGRKRLYEDDISTLTRLMFERGFILIDMDGFFVVLAANTFVNYRRANEDAVL